MANKNMVKKIEGCSNIFREQDIKYVIPLYQRAFAWGDDEIRQLIDDIKDFKENKYYIGSLVVAKDKNTNDYEVIDGQQRLTALFLLLKELKVDDVKNCLTFACREKSNRTLQHLDDDNLMESDSEDSIQKGKKIIFDIINGVDSEGNSFDKNRFIEQLEKVVLFRIVVPQNTDLNRYFEVMNTRGEQLERQDIVKATLMSEIGGLEKQEKFARIWDACRDMTGYVPMHFTNTKDRSERDELFGNKWNRLQSVSLTDDIKKSEAPADDKNESDEELTIQDIIKHNPVDDNVGGEVKEGRVRFESIIKFPFFLLHVLKVLIITKNIVHADVMQKLVPELDDKKLTDVFEHVIKNGMIDGKKISENKEQFSFYFIECLLRCRWLFDMAIIKREFDDNSDGKWSLKQLEMSGQKGNKKPYYIDTVFQSGRVQQKALKERHDNILMLQACLRVSYTSPKVMHWITELLIWLYDDKNEWNNYEWKINQMASNAVRENYLDKNMFNLGVATPHIVFNYLDYLLWRHEKNKYKDFVFEFRNSVEHWYPRNESKDTFEHWSPDDGVDDFGNLCILQRNINSKFSNLDPSSKKGTFREAIAKGSIKLRIMSDLTSGDKSWKDGTSKQHENEMLKILVNACDEAFK